VLTGRHLHQLENSRNAGSIGNRRYARPAPETCAQVPISASALRQRGFPCPRWRFPAPGPAPTPR